MKSTNIASITPDRHFTSYETHGKFSDFSKIKFTLQNTGGSSVCIQGDRCGGNNSYAVIEKGDQELFRSVTPDQELAQRVEKEQAANPDIMPYFLVQSDDYLTLKQRVIDSMLMPGSGVAPGVATLEIGIEALKLAELITEDLIRQL